MCRRIKIEKATSFLPDFNSAQLVVFRSTNPDNTPSNFVWIAGKIEKIRRKLFDYDEWQMKPTHLGNLYNAKSPKGFTHIEVDTTNLKQICRDLKIKKILFIRFTMI